MQENKSSRHNSVTAAVSNGQTTSQALTEVESKRQSRVPVNCITPFCSDALVSPPNLYPPCVVVFVNDPPSAKRRIDLAVFFVVLWSYGRKICLNMCYGNSENSDGCSYLLKICFIYGTNVSVSQS